MSCLLVEDRVVYRMPPKGWKALPVRALRRRRPRLGELPCDTPDLHHRQARTVGEHYGHLQDDLQLVANVIRRELAERLRALAGLKNEGLTPARLSQRVGQPAGFAGENKGRKLSKLLERNVQLGRVRPFRLLCCRSVRPRCGRPSGGHSERMYVAALLAWHDAVVRTAELVSLADIEDARQRLATVAVRTPLDRSRALSDLIGGEVFIKCENLQRTGSFKIRGAYNRISRLSPEESEGGVVAASAGNHAQGTALAASLNDIQSTVFMPTGATLPKIEATKRYGAEVVLTGKDFGEAYEAAMGFSHDRGAVFVHPFDHPHIIAGQGTCGLEILEQMPGVNTIVVPAGGGGLVSGIAAAAKSLRSDVRVVAVQAEGAAAFPMSLAQGHPVTVEEMSTISDGIACNTPGARTFAHVQALVDEVVTVTDEQIAEALVFTAERMKLVLEPAGAAGVAAGMLGLGNLKPPVVVVLSGGNIDPLLLLRVIRFGLSASGRYFAFRTRISDQPGALHRLLGLLAELSANVVGVEHHREGVLANLGDVEVALQIETKGLEHIRELMTQLNATGYSVERL